MSGKVVLLGTLDTKGADFLFVRNLLRSAGVETLVVDVGTIADPTFAPDITRAEVAAAANANLADFRSGEQKDRAM